MTKRLFSTLALLLGLSGLWAGASYAQADSARAVSVDSLAGTPQQPNVAVRRGRTTAAPASVHRVRQRIARISGGRLSARRVLYPLIILPAPPVIYVREGPGGAPGDSVVVLGPLSRFGQRPGVPIYRDYSNYYERSPEEGRPPVVRFRQRAGETPPDSLASPTSPRESPLEGAPSPIVRRVERAMVETGLFRAVGVNFEFNEANILPTFRPTLDAVGEVLRKYPALRIQIAGHTDATGPEDYNQRLSMRRAEAVRQYLIQHFNIDPGRLTAQGYGETQPIASNDTRTGRTLNRRVEFRVLNPEAAERIIESESSDTTQSLEEIIRRTIQEELQRRAAPDTSRQ